MTLDPNLKLSDTSKYTISPIGPIPADWNVGILGDYAYIKARIGWRGLSSSEYTDEGPYLIAGKHIAGSKIKWDHCDHLSEYRYEESKEIQLQKSDIIISKDGTIGRLGFIDFLPGPATINGTMMLIRPDPNHLYPKFIYHYFQGSYFQRIIQEKVSGSSVPHIFQRDMVKLLIPLFSIQEQKKIAAILSSVEDAIQATQAVIEQIRRVKQGLLLQLLTRGIGHTRFKQTEIGEVPEEWELIPFNQVLDVRSGKGFRLDEYVNEGIKLLRIDNVSWGEITWDSIAYLPTHYADEYSELLLKEGDILLALNRPITQGKLKLAILKREDSPAILYQRVGKILFKNDNMLNNFVFHLLNYSLPPFIMEKSVGSDQPFINITALRKLKLPIPTLNEQHKIAAILDENDECIETHNKYLEHLFNLKHGLMQDLLTGRVRVKPDEVNTT